MNYHVLDMHSFVLNLSMSFDSSRFLWLKQLHNNRDVSSVLILKELYMLEGDGFPDLNGRCIHLRFYSFSFSRKQ